MRDLGLSLSVVSEHSLDRYRRAIDWTMSEVAKAASQNANAAIGATFDRPTPWMERAFDYSRARPDRDGSSASMFVMPTQSIVGVHRQAPARGGADRQERPLDRGQPRAS